MSTPLRSFSDPAHETLELGKFFQTLPYEVEVPFADASHAVGFPVTSQLGSYHSARRIAQRDHGIVIEAITGIGFKRANAETIVHKRGDMHMKAVRNRSRKALKEMSVVIAMNLSQEDHRIASEKFNRFAMLGDIASNPSSNRRFTTSKPADAPKDNREFLRNIGK